MKRLFTWIHLSDIHIGHGDAEHRWDQDLVLNALHKDLNEQCQQHRPDAIFVTGDVAFSGKRSQYQKARAWLDLVGSTAGLTTDRIFVVPGNHDIDRDIDRKNQDVVRLIRGLRTGVEQLDDVLGRKADRKRLGKRMGAYLDFAAGLAPSPSPPSQPAEARLFWQHREVHGRLQLRIIGLNTALLAADKEDKGRLALGKEQLSQGLLQPPITPGELILVLSHHPTQAGWLADEREADAWLRNHAHVHLFGHVHDAASESARSGNGGQFVRIAAGAAHEEELPDGVPSGHGYVIGKVLAAADDSLHLHLWPRRWSEKQKRFVDDVDNVPKRQTHATHTMGLTLPTASGASIEVAGPLPAPRPPFGDQGRITDAARFFDRVDVLDYIFSELVSGRNISLVGESQVGKSSVLTQVHERGPGRLSRPSEDFVYLDMQPLCSDDDFFAALGELLGLPEPDRKGWKLKRALRSRRVVLCLDEIEKMSYQGFTHDVRAQLRGLADGNDAPLSLVVASRSSLHALFPDDPMYSSSLASICPERRLDCFPTEVAQQFLRTRMQVAGRRFDDAEEARLLLESGGHPGRLQELAYRSWCSLVAEAH